MAKPEWGVKRVCPECATRFYDLTRDPAICPHCGVSFSVESLLKSKSVRGEAVKPAAAAAATAGDDAMADDDDLIDADDDAGGDDEVPAVEEDDDLPDIDDEDVVLDDDEDDDDFDSQLAIDADDEADR